jgi:hypothetical protein
MSEVMSAVDCEIPGTSSASIGHVDREYENFPFMSSYLKQDITDGLKICCNVLHSLKICEEKPNEVVISKKAKLLGKKMAEVIIELLEHFDFHDDYDLFLPNEIIPDKTAEKESKICETASPDISEISSICSSNASISLSSDNEEYEKTQCKRNKTYIPLETKIKIVNLAREHPRWSLKTLQNMGGSALKNKKHLSRWREEIRKGGNKWEKFEAINKWVLDRFHEARNQKRPVITRMLKSWASQAALQFEGLNFSASKSWADRFKLFNNIRQRKVTRYIKSKNAMYIATILQEAHKFQKRVAKQIVYFDQNYVINTDQTGCEYRCDVTRVLSTKGEKTTEVFLGDFNKVTHSYTAQYAVTASGKFRVLKVVYYVRKDEKIPVNYR